MRTVASGGKRPSRSRPFSRLHKQKLTKTLPITVNLPLKHQNRQKIRTIAAIVLIFPLFWMLTHLPRLSLRPIEKYESALLAHSWTNPASRPLHPADNMDWSHIRLPLTRDEASVLNATLFRQITSEASGTSLNPWEDVVPRKTRYTALAEKLTDKNEIPSVESLMHAVLLCHYANPCCFSTLRPSLSSLLRQSLMPDSLKIIHACTNENDRKRLVIAARKVLGQDNSTDSYSRSIVTVSEQVCEKGAHSQRDFDDCVLRYLLYSSTQGASPDTDTVILSERDILEPTALEKSWMYLKLRPSIRAVQSLPYSSSSLLAAEKSGDPLQGHPLLPSWNHTLSRHLSTLPLVYRSNAFSWNKKLLHSTLADPESLTNWKLWADLLSSSRVLREALYTRLIFNAAVDEDIVSSSEPLSLQNSALQTVDILPQLQSDLAFYKWSARMEEKEMYSNSLSSYHARIDISRMTARSIERPSNGHRLLIIMPWLQMGGSEKAMLDIAERIVNMEWALTFVLTMPDWHEDELGELGPQHHWIGKALALTSDVFDLVAISTNDKSSRAFRHLLESRKPDYILMSNTRWAYAHSPLIKALLPRTIVADYNHMIHPGWNGGGLPRYGANYSAYFDVHFTASNDVATPMEKWIDSKIIQRDPHKIRPCHIGTDTSLFFKGQDKVQARIRMRCDLGIPEEVIVVLFAGRLVIDKGIDVLIETAKESVRDPKLSEKLFFLFVGDGEQEAALLKAEKFLNKDGKRVMLLRPSAQGLIELRDYYAMSDILMLPSVNEGIALVVYEAMAAGMLVMTTDVGGQKEVVTAKTGVLLKNSRLVEDMVVSVLAEIRKVIFEPEKYRRIARAGRRLVEKQFTTERFRDCVINGLVESREKKNHTGPLSKNAQDSAVAQMERSLVRDIILERQDGLWKRGGASRDIEKGITIGIKTYVCDSPTIAQVRALVRSIRVNYLHVRVILGNDGPSSLREEDFVRGDPYTEEIVLPADSGISAGRNALVNMTTTKYFVLLDDDHVLDDTTNLAAVVRTLEVDEFDIVGMRIRNLPGIDEMERTGIPIPRYVAMIENLSYRRLTLCLWNENEGPSVYGMEHALPVDVLHNAFVARTDVLRVSPWRTELQVNEHMTFFLDAKNAGLKVAYLPSQFVHHRARDYSKCYYRTRFREEKFRKLLDYDDRLYYDISCGMDFPRRVRSHLLSHELRN